MKTADAVFFLMNDVRRDDFRWEKFLQQKK